MKSSRGYFIGLVIGLNMFFTEVIFLFCEEERKPKYHNVYRK